jgi:hypothetical protein
MLNLDVRGVLAERPYRSVPELAFLLNSSERTIRGKLQEIPDLSSVRFKKQLLYYLNGELPNRPRTGGSGDSSAIVGPVSEAFCCSEQAAQVFLLAYAARARQEKDGCAYDGAVSSLLKVAGDSATIRRACAELCRAGLFRTDAADPFTRMGQATGRLAEEVWREQV